MSSLHSWGQNSVLSIQSESTRTEAGDNFLQIKIAIYSLFAHVNNWRKNRLEHAIRALELIQVMAYPFFQVLKFYLTDNSVYRSMGCS